MTPDDAARESVGVLASGYPYPSRLLGQIPSIEIATRAGDFVLLRSDFLHAVKATVHPGRLTLSRSSAGPGPNRSSTGRER